MLAYLYYGTSIAAVTFLFLMIAFSVFSYYLNVKELVVTSILFGVLGTFIPFSIFVNVYAVILITLGIISYVDKQAPLPKVFNT